MSRARLPAVVPLRSGRRVLIFSMGAPCSGIPHGWAATEALSGVHRLAELSDAAAAEVVRHMGELRRPGDLVVASVHWGSNWGYDIPQEQIRFAHALIDGGVDAVHGHSSHHPRPIEIYRGKLVLYGCGDFIDDYEGIAGHDEHRDDLRLLYLVSLEADTGLLADLRMAPFRARRMRLTSASAEDTEWIRAVLDGISREFGVRVTAGRDGVPTLAAAAAAADAGQE